MHTLDMNPKSIYIHFVDKHGLWLSKRKAKEILGNLRFDSIEARPTERAGYEWDMYRSFLTWHLVIKNAGTMNRDAKKLQEKFDQLETSIIKPTKQKNRNLFIGIVIGVVVTSHIVSIF